MKMDEHVADVIPTITCSLRSSNILDIEIARWCTGALTSKNNMSKLILNHTCHTATRVGCFKNIAAGQPKTETIYAGTAAERKALFKSKSCKHIQWSIIATKGMHVEPMPVTHITNVIRKLPRKKNMTREYKTRGHCCPRPSLRAQSALAVNGWRVTARAPQNLVSTKLNQTHHQHRSRA